MSRTAYAEETQNIYSLFQMRAQLENCMMQKQNLLNQISKLEQENDALMEELDAAENELEMYTNMDSSPVPENWEK